MRIQKTKHFSAENANLNLSFLIVCILMFRSLEVGRQIATFKYQAKACISFQTSWMFEYKIKVVITIEHLWDS
jgi:hypothetical protein